MRPSDTLHRTVAACQKFVQANLVWDNHTSALLLATGPWPGYGPQAFAAAGPAAGPWYVVASINLLENNRAGHGQGDAVAQLDHGGWP